MSSHGPWVGQSIERLEDDALLTGAARFIDDLEPVAGLCHAAIVRSPHGCADILRVNAAAALAAPGVIGVLTPDDVAALSKPIGNLITNKLQYYPCAVGRTRFFGEPVAVVIAENRYLAEDAADLVEIDYAPRPVVVDPEAAVAPDAPVLHDGMGGNVVHERQFRYGNPEDAFAEAAHVVSYKVSYPRVNSTPIETYGVIADFDRGNRRYTVWSNFQGPYALHPIMCDALRVRGHELRLISAPSSGGSFGIKQGVYPYIVLIALAARRFGRPVKWIEDRLEHLASSSAASGRVTKVDGAFDRDGNLIGLQLEQLENVGAYLRPPDPAALYRMHSTLSGPYRVRNIAVSNKAVVTNQVPSGLNRGFGGPQFYFPLERMMDKAAHTIRIDPIELRRRNVVRADEFPYDTPAGSLLESGDYEKGIALALEIAGYPALVAERDAARKSGRKFGLGIALAVETSASNMAYVNLALTHAQRSSGLPKSGANARARVIMDPLGSVIVHIDSLPNGQGHKTVVAQIIADEMGVNPKDVTVVSELDTFGGAWSVTSGNYSNRFSTTVTSAVALSARKGAAKLRAAAAPALGVEPGRVSLADGMASAPGGRNEPIPIRRLAAQLHWDASNFPDGVDGPISELVEFAPSELNVPDMDDRSRSSLTYSFQCDLAAVEVDPRTGHTAVHKYVTVHDAGKLLNPAVVEGQIVGGFAHGFGAGMMERVTYAADGTLLSATFQDYLCPTAPELPPLDVAHYTTPSPNTVHGAKGLGDGCSMIAPVALANAISDATGLEAVDPPFLPGRIWELLNGGDPDPMLHEQAPAPAAGRPQLQGGLRGEGKVDIPAPRQQVWGTLLSPESLKAIIPGCESVEATGPDSYRARVRISVAGIGAAYDAQIRIFDREAPSRLRLSGKGGSKLGSAEGEAYVTLEEAGGGTT
ncbi:MAG TPA: molybdopterin cofactor-binding domain-containing protein, partial [Sphingomicrobium sp.]|nr:molybdopterin cofactor-binding domain-containing protein [Sphingomicrobium sp.]